MKRSHPSVIFVCLFFLRRFFFSGQNSSQSLPVLVRPLRCLHREDFENFEGHPVGWGTLAWGDGWMVGWMLGVFFLAGDGTFGMFFLINFFFWGRGDKIEGWCVVYLCSFCV